MGDRRAMDEGREPDPEQRMKQLQDIVASLDKMDSNARDLHDWLQDKLMPFVQRIVSDAGALLYYTGMNSDMIQWLREQADGNAPPLDPEEAEELLAFITDATEKFRQLKVDANVPGLDDLIKQGADCVELVKDMAGEEEAPAETPRRPRQ